MAEIQKDINILLVEDAALMRKLEIKALQTLGFKNIIEAEDGADAQFQIVDNPDIDMIISDWNMPNMNGYELLVWVRETEMYKNTPFIMATARGEKKELEKATEAGVSSFISKPFNPEELLEKIKEALGVKEKPKEESATKTYKFDHEDRVVIDIAHLQITDHLALGVMKYWEVSGKIEPKHFSLNTHLMKGWNPVADSVEDGSVDAAFILAPLAMDLFNYGAAIKLILFAHKNGSIFVRNSSGYYSEPYSEFFADKSFFIPHTMSVHNMLSHMFFRGIGLKPGVTGDEDVDIESEVVAPIEMPQWLAENPDAAGYMVAEPLGSKAINAGNAHKQFLSSELWENHPCCVVVFQQEFIQKFPEAVQEFTDYLVEAGKFIDENPKHAAEIAFYFFDKKRTLGLKLPMLEKLLSDPQGIKTGDMLPQKGDLDTIQNYMSMNMEIGGLINLDEFVDLRFAEKACKNCNIKYPSKLHNNYDKAPEFLEPR